MIIRLSAIGDVVFATPLIAALRRSYPAAHLAWLVEEAPRELLLHNPQLDEVLVWPKQEWKPLWRERRYLTLWRRVQSFRRELRRRRFDVVIDLQGLLKSALWAYASGARERIGLGSKEGSQVLMSRVISRQGGDKRIGSEYLHLARALGLETGDFAMAIALSPAAEHYALAVKQRCATGKYAVICPFSTRPQKQWREERWPLLAQELKARYGLSVVMLGGPGEVEAAARIAAGNADIINEVGATTLLQSAAVIKHSSLLIGVDTGLTHMGIAFNVPTVALFGSTCPYLDTSRENARVIYHKLDCSPCRRHPTCHGEYTCMQSIGVDEICAVSAEVMAK